MTFLQKAVLSLRFVGFANMVRAVRFALRRDRQDARVRRAADQADREAGGRTPGLLRSSVPVERGARFEFERSTLLVRFLSPSLVFLGWDGAEMTPSWAVESPPATQGEFGVDISPGGGNSLRTSLLEVTIGTSGAIQYRAPGGPVLRVESPISWTGRSWASSVPLAREAMICGLGERAASLNLRPGSYRLWNRDAGGSYGPGADPLYITMPVYLCLQDAGSYLVFHDTPSDGSVELGEAAVMRFSGGPARHYVAVGTPAEVIESLTGLTGRPPLPPRWALGYQQSQWGWGSEKEMRRVWNGFREHGLPVSVLVLDIDHQRGCRTLTLDETRYPGLPAFARELAETGTRLVAIVDPGVKVDAAYELYSDGRGQDAYVKDGAGAPATGVVWPGKCVFPDFTSPRVRAWWGKQYARHLDHGIEGFWHDMNEPACFAAWGDGTLPLDSRHDMDGSLGDHREAHNVYGLLMDKAGYEGLRTLRPDRRPFILSRSGWVGMQRYAWSWTGDTQTSWDMLRQTIPTVLGLGLCGQPYAGPDVGGFSGSPEPELFIRWFQLAAFLPFFRTHSAFFLPRREPWEMGEEVLLAARKALELRYRLLPYWYTQARIAQLLGAPLVRPLFWDHPEQELLRAIDDEFMVGESLLVAPILRAGDRRRSVRLPGGAWYELSTGRYYEGGGTAELEAPFDSIPVLVRAGTVLPLEEGAGLVLDVYRPERDTPRTSLFYSDAGDGYGTSCTHSWLTSRRGEGCEISWSTDGDDPEPHDSVRLRLRGMSARRILIDGSPVRVERDECTVRRFARATIE